MRFNIIIILLCISIVQFSCSSVKTNKSIPLGEDHVEMNLPDWTVGTYISQELEETSKIFPHFEGVRVEKLKNGLYKIEEIIAFTKAEIAGSKHQGYYSFAGERHIFINLEKIQDEIKKMEELGQSPPRAFVKISEENISSLTLEKYGDYYVTSSYPPEMPTLLFKTISDEYDKDMIYFKVKKYAKDKYIYNYKDDDSWIQLFQTKNSIITPIDDDKIENDLSTWNDILNVEKKGNDLYLAADETGFNALIDYQFAEMEGENDFIRIEKGKSPSGNLYLYIIIGLLIALLAFSIVHNKSKRG